MVGHSWMKDVVAFVEHHILYLVVVRSWKKVGLVVVHSLKKVCWVVGHSLRRAC